MTPDELKQWLKSLTVPEDDSSCICFSNSYLKHGLCHRTGTCEKGNGVTEVTPSLENSRFQSFFKILFYAAPALLRGGCVRLWTCAAGDYFFSLSFFTLSKYSLVILMTTGDRANRAMKFGAAIRPLRVSAISHTTSMEAIAPTTMTTTKIAL